MDICNIYPIKSKRNYFRKIILIFIKTISQEIEDEYVEKNLDMADLLNPLGIYTQ